VMDLSFAVQALALAWLAGSDAQDGAAQIRPPGVHEVPAAIDTQVATLALAARNTEIDALTPAQEEYLDSWRQGS
jgi:adenosylhomocysteinase